MSGILVVIIIYSSSGEVSGMIFATVNIKKKLQLTPPKYYYLVEEIRRKEGIQLLEIWELFPNTRPRFEVPVGLSGLETFSAVDLGKADEVDGSLFTLCFPV